MNIEFEWDDDKDEANRRKHGVSFEKAKQVFDDPRAIPFADTSVVAFVFPAGAVPPTAGLGYVVPASEGTPVVACSVASSKFPDLVGGDHQEKDDYGI